MTDKIKGDKTDLRLDLDKQSQEWKEPHTLRYLSLGFSCKENEIRC